MWQQQPHCQMPVVTLTDANYAMGSTTVEFFFQYLVSHQYFMFILRCLYFILRFQYDWHFHKWKESTTGVCITTELWSMLLAGICVLCCYMAHARVPYATQTAFLQPLINIGRLSALESWVITQFLHLPYMTGHLLFQICISQGHSDSKSVWALNLVIGCQIDEYTHTLPVNALLLNHTFSTGSWVRCQLSPTSH